MFIIKSINQCNAVAKDTLIIRNVNTWMNSLKNYLTTTSQTLLRAGLVLKQTFQEAKELLKEEFNGKIVYYFYLATLTSVVLMNLSIKILEVLI